MKDWIDLHQNNVHWMFDYESYVEDHKAEGLGGGHLDYDAWLMSRLEWATKEFDTFNEVRPCHLLTYDGQLIDSRTVDFSKPTPDTVVESCDCENAMTPGHIAFWSVFGQVPGTGPDCIGDYPTESEANKASEILQRTKGITT